MYVVRGWFWVSGLCLLQQPSNWIVNEVAKDWGIKISELEKSHFYTNLLLVVSGELAIVGAGIEGSKAFSGSLQLSCRKKIHVVSIIRNWFLSE